MSRSLLRNLGLAVLFLAATGAIRYITLIAEEGSNGTALGGHVPEIKDIPVHIHTPPTSRGKAETHSTPPPTLRVTTKKEGTKPQPLEPNLVKLKERYSTVAAGKYAPELLNNVKVWPLLKGAVLGKETMHVASNLKFELEIEDEGLVEAVSMFKETVLDKRLEPKGNTDCSGKVLQSILILAWDGKLDTSSAIPTKENERYRMYFDAELEAGVIEVRSRFALIRALSTLTQLIMPSSGGACRLSNLENLQIPIFIDDEPAFGFRGLLIDTGRNFYTVDTMVKIIRTLAMTKYNVLHWHFADDQSYTFESRAVPEITMSSYHDDNGTKVYSIEDIKLIIEEGRKWGVRIIPELDMPSHAGGWVGADKHDPANPEKVLAQCPRYTCEKAWGIPVNPYSEKAWVVIEKLLTEIVALFPDPMLHLGGDEVSEACWREDPTINSHSSDMHVVWTHFENRLKTITDKLKRHIIRWDDVAWYYHANRQADKNDVTMQYWLFLSDQRFGESMDMGWWSIPSMQWYLDVACFSWEQCYNQNPMMRDYQRRHNSYNHPKAGGLEACAWELTEANLENENLWMRFLGIGEQMWTFTGEGAGRRPVSMDPNGSTKERITALCRVLSNDMSLFPNHICTPQHKQHIRDGREWQARSGYREALMCERLAWHLNLPCTSTNCVREGFDKKRLLYPLK